MEKSPTLSPIKDVKDPILVNIQAEVDHLRNQLNGISSLLSDIDYRLLGTYRSEGIKENEDINESNGVLKDLLSQLFDLNIKSSHIALDLNALYKEILPS